MDVVRALWLPVVAMFLALLLVTIAGASAFEQQLYGEISDHWLLSAFWSRALMLSILCAASFWSGYRISLISNSLFFDAFVGFILPILAVSLFLLVGLIMTGSSEIDELSNQTAVINLGVALIAAVAFSVFGGVWSRRKQDY